MQELSYGFEPAVAICSDTAEGLARCAADVALVGGRVAGHHPIAGADEALEEGAIVDAVLVDATGDDARPLEALLGRLNVAARSGHHPSVVVVPPAFIDLAMARAPHRDVTLLSAPEPGERGLALGMALAAPRALVMEERGDDRPMQLRRLSEEVARIARSLAAISNTGRSEAIVLPDIDLPFPDEYPTAAGIRTLIRERRVRDRFFSADLFADPAWDMLLDLMLARIEGREVAVSSLCIAAAVPPTTALRWIKRLTEEGLFLRTADPRDGRRVFIELSQAAAHAVAAYFRAVARGTPPSA